MLNYLETGIWNIRMGANVSTYKETYTSAVKHLNVEELESMFSEFNRYNVFHTAYLLCKDFSSMQQFVLRINIRV